MKTVTRPLFSMLVCFGFQAGDVMPVQTNENKTTTTTTTSTSPNSNQNNVQLHPARVEAPEYKPRELDPETIINERFSNGKLKHSLVDELGNPRKIKFGNPHELPPHLKDEKEAKESLKNSFMSFNNVVSPNGFQEAPENALRIPLPENVRFGAKSFKPGEIGFLKTPSNKLNPHTGRFDDNYYIVEVLSQIRHEPQKGLTYSTMLELDDTTEMIKKRGEDACVYRYLDVEGKPINKVYTTLSNNVGKQ